MFCAGVTCPIDVCKTRIIARDKENIQKLKLYLGSKSNATLIQSAIKINRNQTTSNNKLKQSISQSINLTQTKMSSMRFLPNLKLPLIRRQRKSIESPTEAAELALAIEVEVEEAYENDDGLYNYNYDFEYNNFTMNGYNNIESYDEPLEVEIIDSKQKIKINNNNNDNNNLVQPILQMNTAVPLPSLTSISITHDNALPTEDDDESELNINVLELSTRYGYDNQSLNTILNADDEYILLNNSLIESNFSYGIGILTSNAFGGCDNNNDIDLSPSLSFKRPPELNTNTNVWNEMTKIVSEEGFPTLFLGLKQRLIYTGLANGIRLAAYGTSRMDLMMRSLDSL